MNKYLPKRDHFGQFTLNDQTLWWRQKMQILNRIKKVSIKPVIKKWNNCFFTIKLFFIKIWVPPGIENGAQQAKSTKGTYYSISLTSYSGRISSSTYTLYPDCRHTPHITNNLFNCASRPTNLTMLSFWTSPINCFFFGLKVGTLTISSWRQFLRLLDQF